jgi:hypothetical protein
VSILETISAFKRQKSWASHISCACADIVSLNTVTSVHTFGLSGVVTNLAIRFLGIVSGYVSVISGGVSVHFKLL